jgi:hypothetical protein
MAKHTSFPEGKGTSTPWGPAQTSQVLTRGVVAYSTSQHGGVSVTINWARKNLSPQAQHLGEVWGGKLWYEEDVQVSILFLEHPEFYSSRSPGLDLEIEKRNDTAAVRRYFPKYFDPEFQKLCHGNPLFDPADLIPGDVVVLHGIGYLVNLAEDSKGRIHLDGGVYARRAVVLAGLSRVTRNGTVIWSLPNYLSDGVSPYG